MGWDETDEMYEQQILQRVAGAVEEATEKLRADLQQAKEAIEALNAGKPLGEIVGLHTAQNALREVERLRAEVAEQARLLGISGSKEARLLAENAELRKVVDAAKNLIAQKGRHHTQIAYERLETALAAMKGET